MIRLARGLAAGLMAVCAVGAVASAVAHGLIAVCFYVAVFSVTNLVRAELAALDTKGARS